jgi:hypothetical protein
MLWRGSVTISQLLNGLTDAPLETVLGMTPFDLLAALALVALPLGAVLSVVRWVIHRF